MEDEISAGTQEGVGDGRGGGEGRDGNLSGGEQEGGMVVGDCGNERSWCAQVCACVCMDWVW